MNRLSLPHLGFFATLLTTYSLSAADVAGIPSVSAGVLERQVQREFNLQNLAPDKGIPILSVDIPEEVLNIPTGISVYIDQIVLHKNFPILDKETTRITDRYSHRELSGQDLMDLCYEIQRIYAENGYIVTWVYPPIQRIDNNTLNLFVVEGFLNDIEVVGNTSYSTRFIRRYFQNLIGQPINYDQLMKGLLLVNENSDISVQAVLRKSGEVGGADLVLQVQDQRPLHLSAGYNNWGSIYTTYNQLSSTFTMGNLATSGDKLALMYSFGMPYVFYYVNPTYTIPLTGSGSNLNLSYMFSHSDTQGDGLEGLDIASWSEIASLTYNQPLAKTRRFEADLNVSFSFSQYKNLQQGATTSFDRLRVLGIGGTIDYTDSLSGRNVLTPTLNIGIPDFLGGSSAIDPLCSRQGAGGRYFILTLNGQRIQPLLTDCMFVMTLAGQGTFNKLPTSVQYILGGMGTVRGYTSAIAVGDVGYCANFEFYLPPPFLKNVTFRPMKQKWGQIMQLLAFIDHGGIYTVQDVIGELSGAYLTSVGMGLRFYGPHNFSFSFDAGFPVMNQYKNWSNILYVRLNMDFL